MEPAAAQESSGTEPALARELARLRTIWRHGTIGRSARPDEVEPGTAPAKEQRAMTATAKKVYDGLTDHVSTDEERERIRRSLYRTDASALGTVLPAWRDRWTDAEIA